MASQTAIGSTKVPVALHFGTLAVANSNGTLYTTASPAIVEYRMPNRGEVIGFSANLSGTLTTGTLQFTPTKNGSPMTGTFSNGTINIGTLGNDEKVQAQNPIFAFERGDTVGLIYGKTGTVAPLTRDCAALLMVLFENYDY